MIGPVGVTRKSSDLGQRATRSVFPIIYAGCFRSSKILERTGRVRLRLWSAVPGVSRSSHQGGDHRHAVANVPGLTGGVNAVSAGRPHVRSVGVAAVADGPRTVRRVVPGTDAPAGAKRAVIRRSPQTRVVRRVVGSEVTKQSDGKGAGRPTELPLKRLKVRGMSRASVNDTGAVRGDLKRQAERHGPDVIKAGKRYGVHQLDSVRRRENGVPPHNSSAAPVRRESAEDGGSRKTSLIHDESPHPNYWGTGSLATERAPERGRSAYAAYRQPMRDAVIAEREARMVRRASSSAVDQIAQMLLPGYSAGA